MNRIRHVKTVAALRRDMGIVEDSDNDGMPDDWEMFHFVNLAQPATADTDNDGLNHIVEYAADTNPKLDELALSNGLLFADSFDAASNGAGSFNHTLLADQSGMLGPVSYTINTGGQDWHAQHGNSGAILLVGDSGFGSRASLNRDFSAIANSLDAPLDIRLDAWLTDTTVAECWVGVTLGSARNILPNDGAAKFGILPKLNGAMEVWTNGLMTPLASHAGNSYRIVISDTAGTGSAFDGNGSKAVLYNGATLVGSYPLAQLAPGDGFLGFAANPYNGSYHIARIDNLRITAPPATDPVPQDVSLATGTYTGSFTHANGSINGSGQYTVATFAAGADYTFTGDLLLPADPAWCRLTLLPGALLTVDGTLRADICGVSLNGGTLTAGTLILQEFDGWTGTHNDGKQSIEWGDSIINGATLIASQPNAQFIRFVPNGTWPASSRDTLFLGNDGATLDSNGHDIGVTIVLSDFPGQSGKLVKSGSGTLTLGRSNTYSGNTTVLAGTLSLGNGTQNSNLADTADVFVESGATLHLNFTGTDTIDELIVAGISKPPDIYSSANSPFITGTGTLTVLNGPASDYRNWATSTGLTGSTAGRRRPRRCQQRHGIRLRSRSEERRLPQSLSDKPRLHHRHDHLHPPEDDPHRLHLQGLDLPQPNNWTEDPTAGQSATPIPGTDNESVSVTLTGFPSSEPRIFLRISAE